MAKISKRKWTTKDGKVSEAWRYSFYDKLGRQHKKSGFKTKVACELALDEAKALQSSKSEKEIIKVYFSDLVKKFIDEHCLLHCKDSTKRTYESCRDKFINPFFGNILIENIKPPLITEFVLKLKKEKLSEKTINNYLTLVKSILNYGITVGWLHENPALQVKKLKVKHKEMQFLNSDEVVSILNATKEHYPDFYASIFTAIFTGIRKGEFLALTWDCVDFKEKTIYINKSLFGGKLQDPKTKTSIRKIDLIDELVDALKEHKKEQQKILAEAKKRNMGKIVFCNKNGKHLDPDNFIERRFEPILAKTKLTPKRHIRWHDLRHTYASLLISKNLSPKYIQHQMGHSSIQITMDRYGHLMPDVHDKAISALNGLLSESREKTRRSKGKNENNENKTLKIAKS